MVEIKDYVDYKSPTMLINQLGEVQSYIICIWIYVCIYVFPQTLSQIELARVVGLEYFSVQKN